MGILTGTRWSHGVPWLLWLMAAFLLMLLYEVAWVRYFVRRYRLLPPPSGSGSRPPLHIRSCAALGARVFRLQIALVSARIAPAAGDVFEKSLGP